MNVRCEFRHHLALLSCSFTLPPALPTRPLFTPCHTFTDNLPTTTPSLPKGHTPIIRRTFFKYGISNSFISETVPSKQTSNWYSVSHITGLTSLVQFRTSYTVIIAWNISTITDNSRYSLILFTLDSNERNLVWNTHFILLKMVGNG